MDDARPDHRSVPPPTVRASEPDDPSAEHLSELKAFIFLTIVMAPVLAGVIIGVYGLIVWIYQMIMGPPTG